MSAPTLAITRSCSPSSPPRGRVFAFEPTATAAMLRSNLRHHNIQNAEVHEVALGATTGEKQDRIYRLWGSEGEVKTYPFYKLDDFVDRHRIERVDCIKIDVDSFDFDVLRGAEQTLLRRNPVVVVELNDALAKRNQRAERRSPGWRNVAIDRRSCWITRTSCCKGARMLSRAWAATASLELLFQRPLPTDERMTAAAGTPVGASFVKAVAAAEWCCCPFARSGNERLDRDPSRAQGRIGCAASLNSHSTTSSTCRSKRRPSAGTMRLCCNWMRRCRTSTLTIEVGVEVIDGKLGIAGYGEDSSRFRAPERALVAMPEPQRVVIRCKARIWITLVFRNVALDGTRTLFKVVRRRGEESVRPTPRLGEPERDRGNARRRSWSACRSWR